MEIDGKVALGAVASLVVGGVSGLVASEINTRTTLAAQQVQIDNIRETVVSRIAEHKVDLAELRAYIDQKAEDLDERVNRLDDRKVDK